jgi:predicted TIM-barrel fold metal-dependent hydrolase
MTRALRANDCLVNVHLGDSEQPSWMFQVKNEYFKKDDSIFGPADLSKVIDEMDANGVERAVLTGNAITPYRTTMAFIEARPDRFSVSAGGLPLLEPMKAVRALERFVADYPVAFANVGPSFWGDGMYPPSDAVYYPLYTKCCELDLPLCINAGLPGPPIPGEVQNPIHLDRVCIRFPELKLTMMHGADPWWDTAIRLMIKFPNLHLMTSAWAPKYLPESLLHYMRTRGKKKIIFASDAPVLSMSRCVTEAAELDLPPEILDDYLYGNSQRLFFGDRP